MDSDKPKKDNIPRATIITFWGALIGVMVVYLLISLRSEITPILNDLFSLNNKTDGILLFLTLILVIRHQCRVAFFDSTFFKSKNRKSEKKVMLPLFLAAILGSILLLSTTFGIKAGALIIVAYSLIFIWIDFNVALSTERGDESSASTNIMLAFIVDGFSGLLWLIILLTGYDHLNGLYLFTVIMVLILIYEFNKVLKEGVFERIYSAIKLMFH